MNISGSMSGGTRAPSNPTSPAPTRAPTKAPTSAPTAAGATNAPITNAPTVTGGGSGIGGGLDNTLSPTDTTGTIITNITINLVPITTPPNGPTAPTAAELATLERNTIDFFNQTLFAAFEESFVMMTPSDDFANMAIEGGWQVVFLAETDFSPAATTAEVVLALDENNANYQDYVIKYVIPSGPYFAFTTGLELNAEAILKQPDAGRKLV